MRRIFAPIVWLTIAVICAACVAVPVDRAVTPESGLNSPVAIATQVPVAPSPASAEPMSRPTLESSAPPDTTTTAAAEIVREPISSA